MAELDAATAFRLPKNWVGWGRAKTYPTVVYGTGREALQRLLTVTQQRTETSQRTCQGGLGTATCEQLRKM